MSEEPDHIVAKTINEIRKIQTESAPDELLALDPFVSKNREVKQILDALVSPENLAEIENWSFDRHLMNPTAKEFAERILHLVRKNAAEAESTDHTVSLFREDDNGARFLIESGIKRVVAESRMRELLHHAHKQHYWIDSDSIVET